MKTRTWRWNILVVCAVFAAAFASGCGTPAGKAATYKAKQISPVHDTKVEKANQKIGNAADFGDKDKGLRGR